MADQWRIAIASAPVAFMDADGAHHAIPIRALRFGLDDALDASGWPRYADLKEQVDSRLASLVATGQVRAPTGPRPTAALVVTARSTGAHAAIAVEVANVTADAADVTVTEEDRWSALTAATLAGVLGEAPDDGTAPGLAHAVGPFAGPPKAGSYPLAAPAAGAPAEVAVPNKSGGGDAFILRARAADDGGDQFVAKVSGASGDAFDLAITWKRTVAGAAPAALAAPFSFVVAIATPPGGARLPAPGTTTLSGGADAIVTPSRPASATLIA